MVFHKPLYDMQNLKKNYLMVVVFKILRCYFTCKDCLMAHSLWIYYHILYLICNMNNQVTELHDKRVMLNKSVCHARQKKKKKILQSSIQEENDGTVYMNDTRLGDAQREQQPYSCCMER